MHHTCPICQHPAYHIDPLRVVDVTCESCGAKLTFIHDEVTIETPDQNGLIRMLHRDHLRTWPKHDAGLCHLCRWSDDQIVGNQQIEAALRQAQGEIGRRIMDDAATLAQSVGVPSDLYAAIMGLPTTPPENVGSIYRTVFSDGASTMRRAAAELVANTTSVQTAVAVPDGLKDAVLRNAKAVVALAQNRLSGRRDPSDPEPWDTYQLTMDGIDDALAAAPSAPEQPKQEGLTDEQRQNGELVFERLTQIANESADTAIANLALEAIPCARALLASQPPTPTEAVRLLGILLDAWAGGVACYERGDDRNRFLGRAFRLNTQTFDACVKTIGRHPAPAAPAKSGVAFHAGKPVGPDGRVS